MLSVRFSVSFQLRQSFSLVPLCCIITTARLWHGHGFLTALALPGWAEWPPCFIQLKSSSLTNPTWRPQCLLSLAVSHGAESCVERPMKLHQ